MYRTMKCLAFQVEVFIDRDERIADEEIGYSIELLQWKEAGQLRYMGEHTVVRSVEGFTAT